MKLNAKPILENKFEIVAVEDADLTSGILVYGGRGANGLVCYVNGTYYISWDRPVDIGCENHISLDALIKYGIKRGFLFYQL